MNKTKCIPFLALVAMLSACTLGNSAKMKKYSKEVSAADWNAGLSEAMGTEDISSKDMVVTVKAVAKMTELRTLNEEKLIDSSANIKGTINSKYDNDTDVGYGETKIGGTMKQKNSDGSSMTYSINNSMKRYYQNWEFTVDDTPTTKSVSVDKEHKQYFVQESNPSSMALSYAIMPLLALGSLPMAYEYADAEHKADFAFYQDGKMFTGKHVGTEEEDLNTTIDEQPVTYCHEKTVTTSIAQLEYKKSGDKPSALYLRYQSIEEETKEYLVDYSSYKAGTVSKEVQDIFLDVTINLKELDLQPIDLTGYIDGGDDVEFGLD